MAEFPEMTPKAAAAFADYVAMGPSRSLRDLLARYCRRPAHEVPTRRFKTLEKWSVTYGWQGIIAGAITDKVRKLLDEAAELDAETFLRTSREYHRRSEQMNDFVIGDIHPMRDRVKPVQPTTNLNLNIDLAEMANKLARELGVSVDDVMAEAEAVAAEAWGRWTPQP